MKHEELFTETQPLIGKVPLVFYIPECSEFTNLKTMIEHYGGVTTSIHECFTYQIEP